jgi:hypothetical protein
VKKSIDIGDAEPHLALVLAGFVVPGLPDQVAAAEVSAAPPGLTAAIGQQTALTNLVGLNDLIFHHHH